MQGVYWLLTIPFENNESLFLQYVLPETVRYIKGQCEIGNETGYKHWQVLIIFKRSVRLRAVKQLFGNSVHAELSRSSAANEYVWKEETRVEGSQFEFGNKPMVRSSKKDWDLILASAKTGQFEGIPPDVLIRCYSSIKRIHVDSLKPEGAERQCVVYYGPTGSGKSKRAWEEATFDAYPKDPNTKFWDGYSGHANVVIDEFRGLIAISHMLRWLDRYPVIVEIKGSSTVLRATNFWITSNLHPREWYPGLDELTLDALLRRLSIELIE